MKNWCTNILIFSNFQPMGYEGFKLFMSSYLGECVSDELCQTLFWTFHKKVPASEVKSPKLPAALARKFFKENGYSSQDSIDHHNSGKAVFNLFQPIVAFHKETSHLLYRAKKMTVFYMKHNIGLKWVYLVLCWNQTRQTETVVIRECSFFWSFLLNNWLRFETLKKCRS